MAVVVCVSASLPVSAADFATWSTAHANAIGAPGTASYADHKTIYHTNKGAHVVCNYNSHTNVNATTGTTTVSCNTYSMGKVVITKTDPINVYPDMGTPLQPVPVAYTFIANTPTEFDTFVAKGNISAIQ